MSEYDENDTPKPAALTPAADLTGAEPPTLAADSVDEFLRWAGAVPLAEVASIRNRIAEARGDAALVDRLLAELWNLPVSDVGRHYVLLATLGELRDGRAASELARFVWHQGLVAPAMYDVQNGCGFEAHPDELLQARAAEMLSYLGTDEAVDETLRIAAEHPRASVRAAAIDAHLFNHDDSAAEIQNVRGRVRAEDQALVGVPRFTRGTNPQDFERAVTQYYDQHPDQRPPVPETGAVVEPPAPRSVN